MPRHKIAPWSSSLMYTPDYIQRLNHMDVVNNVMWGWRWLILEKKPNGAALRSPLYVTYWDDKERLALCRGVAHVHQEQVPVGPCTCGFYNWYEPRPAFRSSSMSGWLAGTTVHVLALTQGRGKIVLGETGFRSEYLRLHTLFVPDHASQLSLPLWEDVGDPREYLAGKLPSLEVLSLERDLFDLERSSRKFDPRVTSYLITSGLLQFQSRWVELNSEVASHVIPIPEVPQELLLKS